MYPSVFLFRRFNHYNTLGLSKSSTTAQIKTRFLELSKKYHPDRTRHLDDATQKSHTDKFKTIKEAYDVLRSPTKRRDYDLTLLSSSSSNNNNYNPYGPTRDARSSSYHRTVLNRTRNRFHNYGRQFNDGSDPITRQYTGGSNDDVPHFDFEKHYRSQRGYDEHRRKQQELKRGSTYREEYHGRPRTLMPVGLGVLWMVALVYILR